MNWVPMTLSGWGRLTRVPVMAGIPRRPDEAIDAIRQTGMRSLLAFGAGRSYGDAALNTGGGVLFTTHLNRIESFDPETGAVICGAGVTFYQLLKEFLPCGYLAPVTPGTGFVTVGGAVANDVHGKNHDCSGSFGDHVHWIDLLMPSGEVIRVSRDNRPELFAATVGGIGLTGVILAVCFAMQRVSSNAVLLREERIRDLDQFFARFESERTRSTFSVGWVDSTARGVRLGRGILETAEVASTGTKDRPIRRRRIPTDFPAFVLSPWAVGVFNSIYYHRVPTDGRERLVSLERFLYPLDSLLDWNRMYGRRGFYQFQCVLPDSASHQAVRRLLEEISRSRCASFLAVLKTLGGEGPGFLSFPMRGYTLALDFPCRPGVEEFLGRLERITLDHGGRIYLAKDACLSPASFEVMYPKLEAFRAVLSQIDPETRINSDMARRLQIRRAGPS